MATADDILTPVYLRLRDVSRTATTAAHALAILSNAQRALNIHYRSVLQTTTLTTVSGTTLYAVDANLPLIAKVERVQEGTRDLPALTPEKLWFHDKNWLSATTAGDFLAWAPIGRELIAVYPSKAGSVNVTGPKQLAALTVIGDTLSIQDQHLGTLEDMLELEMSYRLRLFEAFQGAQQRLNAKLKVTQAQK